MKKYKWFQNYRSIYPIDRNEFKEEDFTPKPDSPAATDDNMNIPALVVNANASPSVSTSWLTSISKRKKLTPNSKKLEAQN